MSCIKFDTAWLLVLAPLAAALTALMSRRGLAGQPLKIARLLLRMLCAALLAFAAAGPYVASETQNVSRVVILDISDSVGCDTGEKMNVTASAAVADLKENDEFCILLFGKEAMQTRSLQPVGRDAVSPRTGESEEQATGRNGVSPYIDIPAGVPIPIDTSQTNIEAALARAAGVFARAQGARQALLVSDGLETLGRAESGALMLGAQGIRLYCAPPLSGVPQDVRIDGLSAPFEVAKGRPFKVIVDVATSAGGAVAVALFKEGKETARRKLSLLHGSKSCAVFELPPLETDAAHFSAKVAADDFEDALSGNNSLSFNVLRGGKAKVLMLGEHEGPPSALETLLRQTDKYSVVSIESAREIGRLEGTRGTQGTDGTGGTGAVVVLDRVSAWELTEPDMNLLRDLCASGAIGLLALGGPKGLGLGGFAGTAVEEALPVTCDPGVEVAMTILLDSSGSMDAPVASNGDAGTPAGARRKKFHVAVDALASALSLLTPRDTLSVVAFSGAHEQVYGPRAFDGVERVRTRLTRLQPTGSTLLVPPLKRAIAGLKNQGEKKTHIVVISDGETQEAPAELAAAATEARSTGIAVTTLGIGEKHEKKILRALTCDGQNGRYIEVGPVSELAEALRDVVSREKEFVRERESRVVASAGSPLFEGLSPAPAVDGFNVSRPKDSAVVHAKLAGGDEPLVVAWQYGLGRSAAFTSSPDAAWLDRWKDWKDAAAFFTRLMDSLLPQGRSTDGLRVFGEVREARPVVTADATGVTGERVDRFGLRLDAYVYTSSGMKGPFEMAQTEPGVYEAAITLDEPGFFPVSVVERPAGGDWKSQALSGWGSVFLPFPAELQRVGCDDEKLRALAELTGGELVNLRTFHLPRHTASGGPPTSLVPYVIICALAVFLAELLVTRVKR